MFAKPHSSRMISTSVLLGLWHNWRDVIMLSCTSAAGSDKIVPNMRARVLVNQPPNVVRLLGFMSNIGCGAQGDYQGEAISHLKAIVDVISY